MKLVIAQMKHETNTFSPVPTPLARFAGRSGVPPEGADAIAAYRGTGSAIAAFIELAEAAGAEIALPVAASAWPSGPVEDAAFEHIAGRIVAAVAAGCDAALLDLHGAMVTASHEDGEGELLRRLRAVAPELPIGVALDMHANIYPDFAARVTTLAGYQTYPHVDMHATGLRAGRPILALLAGQAKPTLAWGRRPMLPHVMRQGSDFSPNRELQARCREIEAQGALVRVAVGRIPQCRHLGRRPVCRGRHRRRSGQGTRCATSFSTSPGPHARSSSIRPSPWPIRSPAPRCSPRAPRAAARSCCSTTATTAPRAARWTR
jgi:microcystin degradation protein MlrC